MVSINFIHVKKKEKTHFTIILLVHVMNSQTGRKKWFSGHFAITGFSDLTVRHRTGVCFQVLTQSICHFMTATSHLHHCNL